MLFTIFLNIFDATVGTNTALYLKIQLQSPILNIGATTVIFIFSDKFHYRATYLQPLLTLTSVVTAWYSLV